MESLPLIEWVLFTQLHGQTMPRGQTRGGGQTTNGPKKGPAKRLENNYGLVDGACRGRILNDFIIFKDRLNIVFQILIVDD